MFPEDWVVVDDDGAVLITAAPAVACGGLVGVLIPAAKIDEVCAEAPEQERLEGWIMAEVEKGASLPGLYPPNAEARARYEKSKA